jgi:hypothetical protein
VNTIIKEDIKDQLFRDFLFEWGDKYEMVKSILGYLGASSEILAQITDFKLMQVEDLDREQREWLSLLTQLDNPIETDFYKPWWILINSNEYDQFIDLTSPCFELFQVNYFPFQPYQWFKTPFIPDIQQFLLTIDDDKLYLDSLIRNSEQIKSKTYTKLFFNHLKFGLKGQISFNITDFYREDIIPDNLETDPSIKIGDNSIQVAGINAKAIVILPSHIKVILDKITYTDESDFYQVEVIDSMNALIFLLTKTKRIPVKSFFLIIDDGTDNHAWFKDDTLYIQHSDKKVILEAYQNIQGILSENP